jgi:hypothetical protein
MWRIVSLAGTERYFQWDVDGGDNYLAYKVSGRSEDSEEFALIGPFFKDPASAAEAAAIDALVDVQFAAALRHCTTPAFKQVCRDSLAILLYHKAWLTSTCSFLVAAPFMDPTHDYLRERVFVGYEGDPDCPVGRRARGVPEHLRSRMALEKQVRHFVSCSCAHNVKHTRTARALNRPRARSPCHSLTHTRAYAHTYTSSCFSRAYLPCSSAQTASLRGAKSEARSMPCPRAWTDCSQSSTNMGSAWHSTMPP